MKYSTILLDVDGTLFDFLRCEKEALTKALATFGVIPTSQMISDYSAINDSLWKLLEKGGIEKKKLVTERFRLFIERYSLPIETNDLSDAYKEALSHTAYYLNGAEDFLAKVSASRRVYFVTNGLAYTQNGRFAVSGITKYAKDVFISENVGFEKPAKEYFEAVFKKIDGFDPKKSIIVGDSLTSDIRGGINAGIDTCWFNPNGKSAPDGIPITYTVKDYAEMLRVVLAE